MVAAAAGLYSDHRPGGDGDAGGAGRGAAALAALGPLTRDEKIVLVDVRRHGGALGVGGDARHSTRRPSRFSASGVLLATGVLTLGDIAKEGDVLATFIWFAVLFTLSGQLNELGFMGFLGQRLAGCAGRPAAGGGRPGAAWSRTSLLHYVFVSQTAHLLALFGVFLDVGVKLGVPAAPLAFQLLFATNYFSAITPQGSSANLLFAGSGLPVAGRSLPPRRADDGVQHGDVSAWSGTPWLLLVAR